MQSSARSEVDYAAVPAVLVANHAPFAWGPDPAAAAHKRGHCGGRSANGFFHHYYQSGGTGVGKGLHDKHYLRKHGSSAYYGQPKDKKMIPAIAMFVEKQLVHLSTVDVVIIAFYFVLVLAIGFYLRGRANTGEDFFMAGREMTAWVAGLSFLSANLGALELMGWAGSAYQYGILATHWYWIGAIRPCCSWHW